MRASGMDVNERMLLQRSYPDPHFDLVAYQKGVIAAARAQDEAGNGRSGQRWNRRHHQRRNDDLDIRREHTGGSGEVRQSSDDQYHEDNQWYQRAILFDERNKATHDSDCTATRLRAHIEQQQGE